MSKNDAFLPAPILTIDVVCTDPATPVSGQPVLCGTIVGVAATSMRSDNTNTVSIKGIYNLSVKGVTTSAAGSAVAVGDAIYYVPGNTPKLSKAVGDTGAVLFGRALGTVGSGATATISVLLRGEN